MLTLVLGIVIGALQGGERQPVAQSPQSTAAQQGQSELPPVSVTVVSPPKDEEEKRQEAADRKAEADDRTRDVKAQETMALFTQRLFWIGVFQLITATAAVWAAFAAVWVNRAGTKHFQITERAWLGVDIVPDMHWMWGQNAVFVAKLTNHGNTPAKITAVRHHAFALRHTDELPAVPDYFGQRLNPALWEQSGFLVKGDSLESHAHLLIERDTSGPILGTHAIFITGYCDYMDAFGDRRRLGWARRCSVGVNMQAGEPDARPLVVTLSAVIIKGYEFERLRMRGEGHDWDEET